jgi:signal transduction histidine kinase
MEIPQTTILLIEDDEEDYILLKKHLTRIRKVQYKLIWETSYESGLERMLQGDHDLCMLDYRLGAQNGIELLRAARRKGYSGPIVILTGAEGTEIDIQALQAGADDYIDKNQIQGELLHRIIRYAIERKKAEHEREKLLREHIATRELEKRKNEFISIVVHELKTPLTSLKGYTQLLGKQLKNNEQTSKLANRLDGQINRLTGLIDDLRDVTRIESGNFKFRESAFALDSLVEDIIEGVQLTTQTHAILKEGEINQLIWGDRERIGQVLTNLLTNAVKYAPDSNTVWVKVSKNEETVTVGVQDRGPGIPREQQAKIFEPFYRLERAQRSSASGLGLGLYIAAEILKQQGGQIWLESEEGQGTTFFFRLPIQQEKIDQAQKLKEEIAKS